MSLQLTGSVVGRVALTKAFNPLSDVCPIIHNKPSGLVTNWPRVLTKASSPLHSLSSSMLLTPSSSSQVLSPSLLTTSWQQDMFPTMSNAGLFNHAMPDGINNFIAQPSLLAQPSLPFQFNTQNHQAAVRATLPTTFPVS